MPYYRTQFPATVLVIVQAIQLKTVLPMFVSGIVLLNVTHVLMVLPAATVDKATI